MLKRFLFSVIILQLWLFLGANAEECSSETSCTTLCDCPYYLNSIRFKPVIPFCKLDQQGTHVCCPQLNVLQKDENKRSVRECKSYQSAQRNCEKHSVVGRTNANPKEYPFMVLIFRKYTQFVTWYCSGTLISSRFVLTAAQCLYGKESPNRVRLGELDHGSTEDDASPIEYGIKKYTLHPNYDNPTGLNDIALIELDAEVPFSDYVMPACLPTTADGRNFSKFISAGWDFRTNSIKTTHLLTTAIDQFDKASCQDKVKIFNSTLQICAGSYASYRVECQLIYGSPIIVDHPDYKCMALIMGITSFSVGFCFDSKYPTFYTRVPPFIDWIESIIWD